MKILFLTRRFYPHVGGVEKHIWKVGTQLMQHGHEVSIIAQNHDPETITDGTTRIKGFPVTFVDFGPESKWQKLRIWSWMIQHIGIFMKADVVHAHDVLFWYYPLRMLLFWKPVYATFHGDEKVFPPAYRAVSLRRFSAFLARAYINVGSYLEKWYGTLGDITIWGAVDGNYVPAPEALDSSAASGASKMPSKTSSLRILLLGRLDPDISIQKYCDILRALQDRKFAFTLDACGDGKLKSAISSFGRVHGFVDDVDPYIERADVVLCSSYLAILEALSHGKRVVAVYDHPMKKDYLTMTPFAQWICVTDSVDEAVEYIATKGKMPFTAREQQGISAYIDSVSWEAVTDLYEQLWKK